MSEPAGGRRPLQRIVGCLGFTLRLTAWTLALAAALVGGAGLFLESDYAEERGRRLLESRLAESLGRRVEVGGVEIGGWPLAVTLHDLVIPGPEPSDPVFARVPELEVQIEVSGLAEKVHVRQVYAREPEVHLALGADGETNLPEFTAGGGGGRVEVTIGSLIVRGGVFRFEESELPLDFEARPVLARAEGTGDAEERRFAGVVSAGEVALVLPDARPYRGSLAARATVESGRVGIAALRFAAPEVTALASGTVAWDDAERTVELAVEARGRAELFNRLGYAEEPLEGPFELAGRFDYAAPRGEAEVDQTGEEPSWTFTADLASERLAAFGLVLTDAAAALAADPAGVTVEIDRAAYAGGAIAGTVAVPSRPEATDGEADRPARVETDLRFEGLSLPALLADRGLELGAVGGSLSGRSRYVFTTDAPAAGDGRVAVSLSGVRRGPGELPLDGEAELTIRDGVVATEDALITAPGQRLTASGSYDLESERGRFHWRLATADLEALYRALPLPPEPAGEAAPWHPEAGTGSAEGELVLAPAGPAIAFAFDLAGVRTTALALDRLEGSLRLTDDAVRDLRLAAARAGGELTAAGTVPFPEETGAPPVDLAFTFAEWPLAELAPLLPEGTPALEGRVSGRVELTGSWTALAGRADLAAVPLEVAGIAVERVAAAGSFAPDLLVVERLEAEVPAGTVTASGRLDQATGVLAATLDAPALDLAAAPLGDLVPGDLGGTVALSVDAAGTLGAPEVDLALSGADLVLAGRELGEAGVAEARARWAGARLSAEGSLLGLIGFAGGGRLDPGAGAGAVDLELAVASDDLPALVQLAAESPLPEFEGSFTGTLTLEAAWPEGAAAPVDPAGVLRLDRVELAREELSVENLEPVIAVLDDGRLELRSLYLGRPGTGDELFVAGSADLGAEGVPLDLDFQGALAASWLEPALAGSELDGTLAVLGSVRGTAAAPRINGQGEVAGGRAILPGFPHALDAVEATVFFEPDGSLIVDSMSAELAGGDVRAQGRLDLPGAPEAAASYRFQARARGFGLRWPEGFVLRGGADLSLASADDARQISGVVDLERIFYLQDVTVSLARLLGEALRRQRLEAGEADTELASTLLNVAVRGPLRVRNNIADLEGQAELVIRGTLAAPSVFGQVTFEPGGTITYAETEYEVERGLLTFSNPLRIDPVIDLVAATEVDGYDVTLQLAGTLERLDARFSSDPPLADLQVLQLLATGTAPTDAGGFPADQGELAGGAASLLYGQAATLVTERVNTLFGFDRFRVNPGVGGAVGFAVGKRLSRDFYVTVSNDPVNDLDYVVQAEWRVSDLVTVVLTQRGEEAFAVDLRWEHRF